jgi:DNA replication protein DnaC
MKTFDQFDFGFQPSIDERQIRELRTLRFIHEASNVIFLGPPGWAKLISAWRWPKPRFRPVSARTS